MTAMDEPVTCENCTREFPTPEGMIELFDYASSWSFCSYACVRDWFSEGGFAETVISEDRWTREGWLAERNQFREHLLRMVEQVRNDQFAAMTRPVVVVIENPEADPDVYAIGDVEVIECSSYPTTHWAAEEREDYADYPAEMRALADRLAALAGSEAAVRALQRLADAFESGDP